MLVTKKILSIFVFIFALSVPAWALYQSSTFGNRSGVESGGSGPAISENFDSCSEWTNINGSLSCDGVSHGSEWGNTRSYHSASTGNNDHWVAATCETDPAGSEDACMILGSNGTDYYKVFFEGGSIYAQSANGTFSVSYAGSYTASTNYTTAAQIDTSGGHARINVWVNGTNRIVNQIDSGDNVARGPYVGVQIRRGVGNYDVNVDDLTADSGAYTP